MVLLLQSFCERDGELQWKKKAVQSQSGESANTVSKSIVAYSCSVIIAAGFSGFIVQLLMVILGVAMLVKYWDKRYTGKVEQGVLSKAVKQKGGTCDLRTTYYAIVLSCKCVYDMKQL